MLIVDFRYALLFGIIILALQQFDGLYLGPKILGESTGLRPLWIIFAITVGGWAAGVAGMFLGVPFTAVIAYLMDRGLDRKLEKRGIVFEVNPDNGIAKRNRNIAPKELQDAKVETLPECELTVDIKKDDVENQAKESVEVTTKNNISHNKNNKNKSRK